MLIFSISNPCLTARSELSLFGEWGIAVASRGLGVTFGADGGNKNAGCIRSVPETISGREFRCRLLMLKGLVGGLLLGFIMISELIEVLMNERWQGIQSNLLCSFQRW